MARVSGRRGGMFILCVSQSFSACLYNTSKLLYGLWFVKFIFSRSYSRSTALGTGKHNNGNSLTVVLAIVRDS